MFRIAVICGGPSLERGISLNSARSLLDHLSSHSTEVIPYYVDFHKNFYRLSPSQLYCNTPSDFDFKLSDTAALLSTHEFTTQLRDVDLVFPAIHGPYGEDGELQRLLEAHDIPFVGCSSHACQQMFYKHHANEILAASGLPTLSTLTLRKGGEYLADQIKTFFAAQNLNRAVVKPVAGGSSIGVFSVQTPSEALDRVLYLFDQNIDNTVLIEPFCVGSEFTVMVLQNAANQPVALMPTQIEISYENNQIFDYRRKYLPTANTFYHTPALFSDVILHDIRAQAEAIFSIFGMRDFARLDGWVLADGSIYFTDLNPITGLEQNSFIFRQASLLGMTHQQTLHYVIASCARRHNLRLPSDSEVVATERKPVFVLFGGQTAERQVSLMSGTNVWLKLMQSDLYQPYPFFWDQNEIVWEVPYSYALNHTTEEVYENCIQADTHWQKANALANVITTQLAIPSPPVLHPSHYSLEAFATLAQTKGAFVFLGLHGGKGENGKLQSFLETHGIAHNGSLTHASALCMDKFATGNAIKQLAHPDIFSLPQKQVDLTTLFNASTNTLHHFWQTLCTETGSTVFIIKPNQDGCSAGIVRLQSEHDLCIYLAAIQSGAAYFPPHTFTNQPHIIELPEHLTTGLIEPFIAVDPIRIAHHELIHTTHEGWVELTIGVLEHKGNYHALNPSITIAEGAVLSLEEKFQGGTGVNLTPPPPEILSHDAVSHIKTLIELVAQALDIRNYARIDIFYNAQLRKLIAIEANTLPGLTPSTVIYHQALAENPPMTPTQFLEKLITHASE